MNTAPTQFQHTLRFSIPLKTVSGANSREHWAAKAKRVKKERAQTMLAILVAGAKTTLRGYAPQASRIVVTLTRVAPRVLDSHDNLPSSMKGVVDQLCASMGIDDRDKRFAVLYRQEKGPASVGVEVAMEAR